MLVGILQAQGRLANHLAGVGDRQRAPALDHAREVQPVDVLHDQEVRPFDLAGVMGPDDVRMIELADRLHLAFEPGHRVLVRDAILGQDLDGDDPLELRMSRLVDRPHPPFAQFGEQLVLAQLLQPAQGDGFRFCLGCRFGNSHGRLQFLGPRGGHGLDLGHRFAALGEIDLWSRDRGATQVGHHRIPPGLQLLHGTFADGAGLDVLSDRLGLVFGKGP